MKIAFMERTGCAVQFNLTLGTCANLAEQRFTNGGEIIQNMINQDDKYPAVYLIE